MGRVTRLAPLPELREGDKDEAQQIAKEGHQSNDRSNDTKGGQLQDDEGEKVEVGSSKLVVIKNVGAQQPDYTDIEQRG